MGGGMGFDKAIHPRRWGRGGVNVKMGCDVQLDGEGAEAWWAQTKLGRQRPQGWPEQGTGSGAASKCLVRPALLSATGEAGCRGWQGTSPTWRCRLRNDDNIATTGIANNLQQG